MQAQPSTATVSTADHQRSSGFRVFHAVVYLDGDRKTSLGLHYRWCWLSKRCSFGTNFQ